PPTLDLTHFDTSQVTDMHYMFADCAFSSTTPPTLDLTHFDTSKVTDMSYMFSSFAYSATTPPTLDLTHFDTSKVTSMHYMFYRFAYSSTTPPTLDLTHFDTSKVTDMRYMFSSFAYSVTTPPALDLTHFDTSKVTNMSYMFYSFAYRATTPPTLDLTHFDTSSVTNMSYMFYSFAYSSTTPVSLNLQWFKVGIAAGGTNVSYMFTNCPRLTELYLESGVFSAGTITSSTNMFQSRNASLNVYVGTLPDQTWMQALSPAPPTVTVAGAPTGTQPAPLPVTLIAPEPVTLIPPLPIEGSGGSSTSGTKTTITDTIPDGLTIDESSITGTKSAIPDDNAITWQRDGQKITWLVPNDMLPTDVSVTVTVGTGLASETTFKNIAYVGPQPTNPTFHQLKAGWGVTEQYRIYDAGTNATVLDDDLNTDVSAGDAYNIQGSTTSLYGYTYYGYKRVGIDADIQTGVPAPAFDDGTTPLHGSDFETTNHETIILYYKKTAMTVTIHYVDQDGAEIASPTVAGVNPNTDYYLLNSYFDLIGVSGTTYTYFNYAANGDGSVKDQAMPAPALAPGNSPVYPDGSVPTFSAAQMTGDKDVTLYFTTQKAVTVHYVEKGNPSHVLHPDAIYFVPSDFDGDSAVIDTLTDSVTSKDYSYTSAYSLDGGLTTVAGSPGTVDAPADITLYYATSYTVTEKFHVALADGEDVPTVLAPDIPTSVDGGDPFYSSGPPATIGGYNYIGYKFGNDSNPLQEGYPPALIPLIPTVLQDENIIYIYEPAVVEPQIEPSYTVQVRYHLWTADGEVIVTDSVPGTWKPGDKVDPSGLLNAHKPYGFGDGVPVGNNWTVSGDDVTTFDIYYPDTPPVINVENDTIYVRKPVELTLDDILRIAGVSITDAEEDIPLSWLKENGYSNITWSIVNYPSGDGYIITLQVTDTPGLKSDIQSIVIFVLDQPEHIRKPKTGETPPSDYTPKGTEWGLDDDGDWVIYIPTKSPKAKPKTPAGPGSGLGLPKTGDSIALVSPVVLAGAGAALLFGARRRRRRTNLGD
ncbi:MAG: BspA family leucine-rich repeat surface protein, partial [Coriobacteriia bacterium]|nr:BspA family leucine-rich repeat surface protein [Coriobacteriia bacterium]